MGRFNLQFDPHRSLGFAHAQPQETRARPGVAASDPPARASKRTATKRNPGGKVGRMTSRTAWRRAAGGALT